MPGGAQLLSDRYTWAALQGALFYGLAYFVFLHVLVISSWRSPDINAPYHIIEIVNPDPHEVAHLMEPNNILGRPTPTMIDELLLLWQGGTGMISRDSKTHQSANTARDLLKGYQGILTKWNSTKDTIQGNNFYSLVSDGNKTVERLQILHLLQQPSLSDTKNDTLLTSLVERSLLELESLANHSIDIQWATVRTMLLPDKGFPVKKKISNQSLYEMVCPLNNNTMIANSSDTKNATMLVEDPKFLANISLYAQEKDLEAHLTLLESVLDQRMTDPKKRLFQNNSQILAAIQEKRQLLKEACADADSILNSTLDELSEEIIGLASSSSKQKGSLSECSIVREPDVAALINAGLEAVTKHKDLQSALIQALKQIDAALAESLILDADYLATESPITQLAPPTGVQLRRLCDTPLLNHLAAIIDRFLDLIGGYNDSLDQYLDHAAERLVNVNNPDASSLGKVFVFTVLVRSGHVQVPIPPQVRDFFLRTSRGRAFLESLS